MEITEVRIKLMDATADRLRAFCSITIDDAFVVRDLKIIDGATGPFVAMPSRKLTGHCPNCGSKNHLRANHCNQCGARQPATRLIHDEEGRARLYADIAHPINSECREMIQARVIEAYEQELELAKEPGYVSRYDEFDSDYDESDAENQTQSKTNQDARKSPAAEKSEEKQTSSRPDPSRKDSLGSVPAPPQSSAAKPPESPSKPAAKEPPKGKTADKQTPHSKEMEERKEAKTPWQNRPDEGFGAGIF